MTPLEDPSSLYYEAAQRTWLHLGEDDAALSGALREVLLHRDGDLQGCILLVAKMLTQREQWDSVVSQRDQALSKDALERGIRQQLDRTLERVVCEGLSRLTKAFPRETLHRLSSLANSLSERPGYKHRLSPLAICRELKNSPGEAADHLIYWRALAHLLIAPSTKTWRKSFNRNHLGFDTVSRDIVLIKDLVFEVQERPELLALLLEVSHLPPASFPAEQWPLTKALFRILNQAVIELQLLFSSTRTCDFSELALLARHALKQRGTLSTQASATGTDLRHLLVDEMQDTSTPQYELIERLTEGWAGENKTIFLVGDPKQSIYLFRQARVERFVNTMRTGRLGSLPIGVLQLTTNFRSQAGLVADLNRDFSKVFPHQSTRPEDVPYVQASFVRKVALQPGDLAGVVWHLSVYADAASEEMQKQLLRSARDVRDIIEHWRRKPLPEGRSAPWKIAVLVRSRQNLARILPELRRDPSIPVRALKIDTLDKCREILDLLALTRALLHPADRTAWLALLRAPWCGLTLEDLHTLTGRDEAPYLGCTLIDLISTNGAKMSLDGVERLRRILPVLRSGMRSSVQLRLPERVERTWRSLGGHLFLNDIAYRNAGTFLELLRTLDQEAGEIKLPELKRRLERLFASVDGIPDAVDLVTIHGSKGLEWDVVLVPELEQRAPIDKSWLFEWEELLDGGFLLSPISAKGEEATALSAWLRGVRSRREAAERKRLFYVACTRAREEVHLFGIAAKRQDGTVTPHSGSLLQAVWSAAEDHLSKSVEPLLTIPLLSDISFDIAASGESASLEDLEHSTMLHRLPLHSQATCKHPPIEFTAWNAGPTVSKIPLEQAVGSFASRCLGTTIHSFLDEVSNKLAGGVSISSLVEELPKWSARIQAVLRSYGLPPQGIEQQVRTVVKAIHGTLSDRTGQWVIGPRRDARNEVALATLDDEIRHYRVDRIFWGGSDPGTPGDHLLWLIDYKTSTYTGSLEDEVSLQAFLACEQKRYEAQLQTYARLMNKTEVRLALWFPLLKRLIWWVADDPIQSAHV